MVLDRLKTFSALQSLSTLDPEALSISLSLDCPALDCIFDGNGIRKGEMLEISGPPGIGKTSVVRTKAANCLCIAADSMSRRMFAGLHNCKLHLIYVFSLKMAKTAALAGSKVAWIGMRNSISWAFHTVRQLVIRR